MIQGKSGGPGFLSTERCGTSEGSARVYLAICKKSGYCTLAYRSSFASQLIIPNYIATGLHFCDRVVSLARRILKIQVFVRVAEECSLDAAQESLRG